MKFGRLIRGGEESVDEDARVPAELDATHHADNGSVLEDVDIAKVDGRVLGGGDHFGI